MESKLANTPGILCMGLPDELEKLLKYSRKLEFEEEPDYKGIKTMFKNYIMNNGDTMNMEFEWNQNKSEESKEEEEEDEDDKK